MILNIIGFTLLGFAAAEDDVSLAVLAGGVFAFNLGWILATVRATGEWKR